jgi:hypothetical protein
MSFMKRSVSCRVILTLLCIGFIFGVKTVTAYPNGSPAGYTGSPFDNKNCVNCHGGSASTVTGWITSNIPTQGYTAGQSYTITLTATGSGSKGFEISPMNNSGSVLGSMTPGTGTKLVGGNVYLTQSSAKSGNPATWTFTWTAPAAGTGSVTFYCAFTVTKPVTKLCTMTVNEYLPLGVTVTANPTTILSGQSSQLNAAAIGGSGTYTYSWSSNPAGFTSTLQNPVAFPTTTTTYTCVVNDGSSNVSGNATVTVNIPSPLAVVASANPSSITSGQASQLNAIASGGSGNYTYSWVSSPAGFTSGLQNPVIWPTSTAKYIVTVNDGTQTKKDSVTVTVTLAPLTAVVTATPSSICSGQTSQLNVVASGGSGTYTYLWSSIPAGFTSALPNPVVAPSLTTKYIVHTSDGSISRDDTTLVLVSQPATAAAGNDTTYPVTISQIPVNGFASFYTSVLWTTSGSGSFSAPAALNGFYTPSAADKTALVVVLTLTAMPVSPCVNPATSSETITFSPVGIGEASAETGLFRIHPNPSAGQFSIILHGYSGDAVQMTVADIRGIEIFKTTISGNLNHSFPVDLSMVPKGTYFVKIAADSKSQVEKLIIR